MKNWNKINKIFFVGIGGVGISGSALIASGLGKEVCGSDAAIGEVVRELQDSGVKVFSPHRADNLSADFDLLVYSVAVAEANPERIRAKELGIEQMSYPQFLGLLLENKYGIGVSGTDGKTTTTAMLAKIFLEAETDPTVLIGAKVGFLDDKNARAGQGEYFIFESDEYRRAFDNYRPQLAVITNIGVDHLDYYSDSGDYFNAFKAYLEKIPQDGWIVINNDDKNSVAAVAACQAKIVTFGVKRPADFAVREIEIKNGRQEFAVMENGEARSAITLGLPGDYNVYNALAAIAAAKTAGVSWQYIAKALDGFAGVWRRFEKLGKCGKAEVIADYAHTPDAVKKAIKATQEFYPQQKIITVFQPHQYARTKNLFNGFAEAFDEAEKVLLPDIFYVEGREKPEDFDVSSKKLAEAVSARGINVEAPGDLASSEEKIKQLAEQYDIILVLGAGNIYETAKNLVK